MERLLVILLLSIFYTSTAHAIGGGFSLERGLFKNADISGNEVISFDEASRLGNFRLSSPEVFAKYDKSGEGFIDFTEFREYIRLRSPSE